MTKEPLRNVRYKPAFRQWLADGQIVTDAVLEAAGRQSRDTLYKWIKQERWHEAADELFAAAIQEQARGEASREAMIQKAKDEAQLEIIEELREQRRILKMKRLHLEARLREGADVDTGEIKEVTSSLLDNIKGAANLGHSWEQAKKVEVTVEEVQPDELAAIKQRLAPVVDKEARA